MFSDRPVVALLAVVCVVGLLSTAAYDTLVMPTDKTVVAWVFCGSGLVGMVAVYCFMGGRNQAIQEELEEQESETSAVEDALAQAETRQARLQRDLDLARRRLAELQTAAPPPAPPPAPYNGDEARYTVTVEPRNPDQAVLPELTAFGLEQARLAYLANHPRGANCLWISRSKFRTLAAYDSDFDQDTDTRHAVFRREILFHGLRIFELENSQDPYVTFYEGAEAPVADERGRGIIVTSSSGHGIRAVGGSAGVGVYLTGGAVPNNPPDEERPRRTRRRGEPEAPKPPEENLRRLDL